MRKTRLGPALAAALIVGGAAPATAAPPEPEVMPLSCDNGQDIEVVVRGNGPFTPGHIVGSNKVIVPIAFGDFEFHALLPGGGEVHMTLPDEDSAKGGGNVAKHNPRETVTCTFTQEFTLPEYDAEFDLPAGTIVTFSGSVTGFMPGR